MDITLDTDELGIWLVEATEEGPKQLGHITWTAVTRGVQTALLQTTFLIALIRLPSGSLDSGSSSGICARIQY